MKLYYRETLTQKRLAKRAQIVPKTKLPKFASTKTFFTHELGDGSWSMVEKATGAAVISGMGSRSAAVAFGSAKLRRNDGKFDSACAKAAKKIKQAEASK